MEFMKQKTFRETNFRVGIEDGIYFKVEVIRVFRNFIALEIGGLWEFEIKRKIVSRFVIRKFDLILKQRLSREFIFAVEIDVLISGRMLLQISKISHTWKLKIRKVN